MHTHRPRQTAASPRALTISRTKRRDIVYISNNSESEQDFLQDFLYIWFNCEVSPYGWDAMELKKDQKNLSDFNPCLVIFASPLKRKEGLWEEVWDTVRKVFPATPVLWLAPDSSQLPKFLPTADSSVMLLITDLTDSPVQRLTHAVSRLTGIEPFEHLRMGPV